MMWRSSNDERVLDNGLAAAVLLLGVVPWCGGCQTPVVAQQRGTPAAIVEIDLRAVLQADYLGAGVQCSAYPWFDVSEQDWHKVFQRLDYMRLPFTRVLVDWTSFFAGLDADGRPRYTFESAWMLKVYKLLDYCQDRGVLVMFGQWGWANTARHDGRGHWDVPPDSQLHARISADLIQHVVDTRGYSCVKWFDPINEPDGSWSSCAGDWQLWTRVLGRLHEELQRRGLLQRITICGPGDAYRGWVAAALDDPEVRRRVGAYNDHQYVKNEDVIAAAVEDSTRLKVRKIEARDPGKHYFAGELGCLDGKNARDQQVNVYQFWYGVTLVDAAVQMMRGGASGSLAWYLDDAMHWKGDSDGPLLQPDDAYERRKIWGFWNIVGAEHGMPDDEQLRPWFYAWSALCRLFPPGSQTLDVDASGVRGVRVAAARYALDAGFLLSIVVVNHSNQPQAVRIVAPGASARVNLSQYEYFDLDHDNRVDAWFEVVDAAGRDVFPQATRVLRGVDLERGLRVDLPSAGIVFLTTLESRTTLSIPTVSAGE